MKIFSSQKATFLAIFLAGFVLAIPFAFAAGRFSDVSPSDWFASSVEKMANAGIVKGKSDGNFHPSDSVSRAEIAVMLDRMMVHLEAKQSAKTMTEAEWNAQIKVGIEAYIQNQQQEHMQEQETAKTEKENNAKSLAISATDHILGKSDATVVMFLYSDYHCPFCQKFHATMKELFSKNQNFAVVFRPLPMAHAETSTPLHEIAECVASISGNDAFWKWTDKIFADENGVTTQNFETVLKNLGIANVEKISACYTAGTYKSFVQESVQNATNLGVQGTPNAFLKNQKTGAVKIVEGAYPLEEVQGMLEAVK